LRQRNGPRPAVTRRGPSRVSACRTVGWGVVVPQNATRKSAVGRLVGRGQTGVVSSTLRPCAASPRGASRLPRHAAYRRLSIARIAARADSADPAADAHRGPGRDRVRELSGARPADEP